MSAGPAGEAPAHRLRAALRARVSPDGDALGLDAALWRAVDVFRVFSVLYAAVALALAHEEYRRPRIAWLVLALMALWTAYVWLRRSRPARLVVADLAMSFLAVLSTRFVDDVERVGAGASTLPLTWPAASVLAWAVWRDWRGGLAAAVVVGVADLLVVDPVNGGTVHNIVLLLVAGTVVGYGVGLYRRTREALARALQVEAATRERERLARGIHDSVLQVLAYVQRRGSELGGEAGDLGRLAGEQERLLRSLVSTAPPLTAGPDVDLRAAVAEVVPPRAELSSPAEPVPLPRPVAAELVAAVGAALDNVRRHAGAGARVWVLLEDEGDAVVVTVRDDGVGMAPGRLADAEREGRLGVASSVRGRVRDLGGQVEVATGPGAGTEVEMRVPRRVGA